MIIPYFCLARINNNIMNKEKKKTMIIISEEQSIAPQEKESRYLINMKTSLWQHPF